MSKKLPFTEEEMSRVFDTNLIEYAMSQGFEVKKADRKTYHVKSCGSLYLFPKGYHHFSSAESGNILDFAKNYQGLSFTEAVEQILGIRAYTNTIPQLPPTENRGDLILPQKSDNTERIRKYLIEDRCLDGEIVDDLIKQGIIFEAITESKGAVFINCAFVSFKGEKAKYCALRGMGHSNFKQDVKSSDKSYGFLMNGTSNRVFTFESPLDAISHATLMKLNGMDELADYRISEGCLSDKALSRFLENNPQITEIVFCFDNDINGKNHEGNPHNHGQEFAKKCVQKFKAKGYTTFIQTPTRNDFNADLQYIQKSVMKLLREMELATTTGEKNKKILNIER